MFSYIIPTTVSLPPRKEILDQNHIFKSTVQTDNLSSIASHLGKCQTHLLLFISRDLCRCLQPCLISSMTFAGKRETTANHKRIYKFIMDLIPHDWKHLLKTESSQKKNLF